MAKIIPIQERGRFTWKLICNIDNSENNGSVVIKQVIKKSTFLSRKNAISHFLEKSRDTTWAANHNLSASGPIKVCATL